MPTEPITNLPDLLQAVRRGKRFAYLLFWGHRPLPSGEIGTPCLSQWWPARFVVEGLSYPTAEHFMMAEKARLFGDEEIRAKILQASSPSAAKKLGRQVRGFHEDKWRQARFQFVMMGNLAKFSQNPALAAYLLGTGDQVLVEASPVDRIWGIGLGKDHADALRPECWKGLNLLGFALMATRRQLRGETL